MTLLMLISVVLITLALVFYSIGVWSERIARRLKVWHAYFFWLGLVCDAAGTAVMIELAGGLKTTSHGISGAVAILLMTIHAVWATTVLKKKSERAIRNFHKFSLIVWLLWLIPYFSGLWLGMKS